MKTLVNYIYSVAVFFALSAAIPSTTAQQSAAEKPIENSMNSVVTVLTGTGSGSLDKLGSGVIIRSDGVILTAYHVIKDANQVQIRLKSGEIFDKVDFLGFDERRDVAAIRISGSNLSAVSISSNELSVGQKVFVISNPQSLTWTVANGLLSAVRIADEIPNAGRGFKVIQFSAPVSAGSSGGLLTDENGGAIGLIVSSLTTGQNLNFAIPLSSVSGLGNSSQVLSSFGRGTGLELPQATRPPSTSELMNADPKSILKDAKFFYIYSYSDLINDQMMENALMKRPEFAKWKLIIVKDRKLADIDINVEHDLFTWNYRYSMTDRRTNILLTSGKVTAWDGNIASGKFAKDIIEKLRPGREAPKTTEKKKKEGQ